MPGAGTITPKEIRVAGSGAAWYAPIGTALPISSTAALDPAFINLGFCTDGFNIKSDLKTQDIDGWQSQEVLRVINTTISRHVLFELMQMNQTTLALALGYATVTPSGAAGSGIYSVSLPTPSVVSEFSLVFDWIDGPISQRIVFKRAAHLVLPDLAYGRKDALRMQFDIRALVALDGTPPLAIYGVDPAIGA